MRFLGALFLILGFLGGCSDDPQGNPMTTAEDEGSPLRRLIELDDYKVVVPSDQLPQEVTPQVSNNNLDVVLFQDRLFLVFRTAPSHFASTDTVLYVVSRFEDEPWHFEGRFSLGADLREPRFFVFHGELYLYFALLGEDPFRFTPHKTLRTRWMGSSKWSPLEEVFTPGFIPWRIKYLKGKPALFGYEGGENIYNFSGKAIRVSLLTTENGWDWIPWDPRYPVILEGGCSETDGTTTLEGDLYIVCRNEAGDKTGFGSKICIAPQGDFTRLTCRNDPRKFDSPLLFAFENLIFLIARRNLSSDGGYDLYRDYPYAERLLLNQLDYWTERKRCSLWHLDRRSLEVSWILDFPSRGDTCFPSLLERGEGAYQVFNYTSDPAGPDRVWLDGQLHPTMIVTQNLKISSP
jgi:hypothetical protein